MGDHINEENPPTIDLQVTQIINFTNLLRELFQKGSYTLPTNWYQQLNLLSTTAINLSENITRLEKVNQRLYGLIDIGQIINSSLDLDAVLRIAMDTIIQLTDAERGFLMLLNPSGELVVQIARNWAKESIREEDIAISRSVVRKAVSKCKPILTTNAKEDPRFGGEESIIAHNLRSILCVPLRYKNKVIGAVYTDNRLRSGVFGEPERDLAVAFTNHVAVAIENARLFNSLRSSLTEIIKLKSLQDNVFNSIASGVITTNKNDVITLCTQSAQHILKSQSKTLIGKSLQKVLSPNNQDFFNCIASIWKSEQNLIGMEIIISLQDREQKTLMASFTPLRDDRGVMQGVAIVFEDISERKRLEAKRRLLERMVSPAVIEQLTPEQMQLGSKRNTITTLFADLRGFTSFGELFHPEKLLAILNGYLASAADAILSYQGTIDKFQGDAVMAWFNAPILQHDHTLRAVNAALEIQNAANRLRQQLPPNMHLRFSMGIHTGEAILGMVGTEKRSDYTAIGDSINTAKRIQEIASPGQILISEEAYKLVAKFIVSKSYGELRIKGKSKPIRIYEVLRSA